MFAQTTLILGTMAAAFVVTLVLLKAPPELAMIVAAVVGAAAGGFGLPVRHLVEGTFTYFDIILTIVAATLFMKVLKESGILYSMIRSMVKRFYGKRAILLVLLMFVMLLPGALTGSGTVSILVSGGIVATVLGFMGVSPVNRAAIVFLGAALSVFAPPVNIYAMIIAGGVNMPYVGFFGPLAITALVLAVFCVLYLGWRGSPIELDQVLKELPAVPDALQGLRLIDLCREEFDVLVMNPPFGNLCPSTKNSLVDTYPNSKGDLLCIFVERGLSLLGKGGLLGAITSRACLFLSSFQAWREHVLLGRALPVAMADLGHGVMDDAMVEAAAYVLERQA